VILGFAGWALWHERSSVPVIEGSPIAAGPLPSDPLLRPNDVAAVGQTVVWEGLALTVTSVTVGSDLANHPPAGVGSRYLTLAVDAERRSALSRQRYRSCRFTVYAGSDGNHRTDLLRIADDVPVPTLG
jgi:hypothetical protein